MTGLKPLRILHVLAPAPVGGLESVVRALAVGHSARGHQVTIAAVTDHDSSPFLAATISDGLVTELIPSSGRDYRRERRYFSALLASFRPDVVHSHGYRPDILDLPVARAAGIPTLTTMHGFTGGDWKVRIYERLQMRSARAADAVVAVSRGVETRLRERGVSSAKVHLIRNAYSSRKETTDRATAAHLLGIGGAGFRIAWIGRLSDEKGPDVMLAAMEFLRDVPIALSFIGDGPARTALETRAAALGVADRVTFHGVVADASKLLPAFDVLALSSRTEGTPMVILEAMAAETPIVATRVGGVPDILSAVHALLVEPERPDLLASALRSVFTDPIAAAARAASARRRLDAEFGTDAWLDRYEQLYNSLLR